MKNGKILPFGDWFKVYEKAGMNFKKSQQLLESKIFEASGNDVTPGEELGSLSQLEDYSKRYGKAKELIAANSGSSEVKKALTEIKKILQIDPKFIRPAVLYSVLPSTGKPDANDILAALIAIQAGNKNMKVKDIVSRLNVSIDRVADEDIKLTPSGGGFYKTRGKVKRVNGIAKSITNPGVDSESAYDSIKQYVNNFNVLAEYSNYGSYYKDESVIDGYFNPEETGTSVTAGNPTLYLAGTYQGGTAERSEEEEVDVIGAESAQVGQAAIKFKEATLEKGGAEILPTEASKIEALAKTIMAKFAGKTIAGFELLSSASPNYGAIENKPGWESNYPNGITNVGDPGAGTDDASKNAKLAYERGVSFMKALNAKLNEMGHPGFADYKVRWQIATQGGPEGSGGRFVDLQITTNEKKGTIVKKTDVYGKDLTVATSASGEDTGILYAYQFNVY